jgi:hypothetical protein
MKAGILLSLSGEEEKAREVWSEVERRFPETRCCYFASLARRLGRGQRDNMEDIRCHAWDRSEMCYLVALLCEKQGNTARSRELMEMCLAADPTLRWPAYLARAKLTSSLSLLLG